MHRRLCCAIAPTSESRGRRRAGCEVLVAEHPHARLVRRVVASRHGFAGRPRRGCVLGHLERAPIDGRIVLCEDVECVARLEALRHRVNRGARPGNYRLAAEYAGRLRCTAHDPPRTPSLPRRSAEPAPARAARSPRSTRAPARPSSRMDAPARSTAARAASPSRRLNVSPDATRSALADFTELRPPTPIFVDVDLASVMNHSPMGVLFTDRHTDAGRAGHREENKP